MKSLGDKIRLSIVRVLTFAMLLAIGTSTVNLFLTSYQTLIPPMNEASAFASSVLNERINSSIKSMEMIGLMESLYSNVIHEKFRLNMIDSMRDSLGFDSLDLVDSQGKFLNGDGELEIKDYYLSHTINGESYVGILDESTLYFSAPIWKGGVKDTFTIGNVVGTVNIPRYLDLGHDAAIGDEDLVYFILDNSGNHIHSDLRGVSLKDSYGFQGDNLIEKFKNRGNGFAFTNLDGGYSMSFDKVDATDWYVAIAYPAMKFLSPLLWGVLGMLIISLFSYVLARKMANRIGTRIKDSINYLLGVFHNLEIGKLGEEIDIIESQDEIETLSRAISDIVHNQSAIIKDISVVLNAMSEKDMTATSKLGADAYIGDYKEIFTSMTHLQDTMAFFVESIKASAECVDLGSSQLAICSQDLAEGTQNQALSIDELSNTIKLIYDKVDENVKVTESVADSIEQLSAVANSSEQAMSVLLQNVTNIHDISSNITKIIDDIEDISNETNLLSLNAMIEAARAGESGRGFSVVAKSIGKLSEQSKSSASKTRDLINSTYKAIEEGVSVTNATSEEIHLMINDIRESIKGIQLVKTASLEQKEAIKTLESSINNITLITQSTSAAAEEQSATSEELASQAECLDELVKDFKV